ncbi:MAG: tRNA (adenosine(37)-N6)-dimethylallyltransferase MiaA [Clostridia bacterium]
MQKPKLIAVVGATASGKSGLALALAQKLNGEILCMDSMQIYRRMNIGTAKPTAQEQALIRHHLLDIVEPTEPFAVADYAHAAEQAIAEVLSRGKLPLLVGGTGLYLNALMHGYTLGGVKSDEKIREKYTQISQTQDGKERLHGMLEQADPITAKRLHPNDIRRVIRALEIYELTGKPMSEQPQPNEKEQPYSVLPLGLQMPREVLYARIADRVVQMMRAGLLDEVRGLLNSGVPSDAQAMQGIGYKELVPVVQGKLTQQEAVHQINLNTRHYSKRQGTWLQKESNVLWLDALNKNLLQNACLAAEGYLTSD